MSIGVIGDVVANVRGQSTGDRVLVLPIARCQDLRGCSLGEEEVNDVEEPFKSAIFEVIADGDESNGDARGDADGVLDIQVLLEKNIS